MALSQIFLRRSHCASACRHIFDCSECSGSWGPPLLQDRSLLACHCHLKLSPLPVGCHPLQSQVQGTATLGKKLPAYIYTSKVTIPDRFPASFGKALEVQKAHDPEHVFEPELFTNIRTGKPYKLYPRCVVDKACYCVEDIHCPEQHRCVASLAPGLSSYKICKPDWRLRPMSGRA
jgi:hypothetical protein